MDKKEFANGLMIKAPHDKAPEFVKCSISIKRKDFGNWLRSKPDEWINLDVKVSKDGKWYAEVNNWKPGKTSDENGKPTTDKDYNDKIPF